tara:strand:+ start:1146 stop:2582 length:1437 start_codon:yes stop_codon:yes gene_type:complete
MNKIKISFFNKLIILSIIILFSFLFYLSVPALYDYERLQNQLKIELSKKFDLNVDISKNIKYRILPTPHFEVIDSKLYSKSDVNPKLIGNLKNTKIFVTVHKIYNQKYLNIKNVVFTKAVFNFNKKNINFLIDNLKKKRGKKKIIIKKSKFFFKDKEKTILIFPINNLEFYYSKNKLANVVNFNGLVFNSKFIFNLTKEFNDEEEINFSLKFPAANLSIKNILKKIDRDGIKFQSLNTTNFLGSKIKTEINFKKNMLKYESKKTNVSNNLKYSGSVNFKPFYLTSEISIENWNWLKILTNSYFVSILLSNDFAIHKNFNSKIKVNINSFFKNKVFRNGILNIETQNGKLSLDESYFELKDFGNITFDKSGLFVSDGSTIFKTNVLLNINKPKKFYNTFQVPLSFRKKIKKIQFSLESNLSLNSINVSNVIIDDKNKKQLNENLNRIIRDSNIMFLEKTSNWIEIRKIVNKLIKEINLV